jgi:hypothetical protein
VDEAKDVVRNRFQRADRERASAALTISAAARSDEAAREIDTSGSRWVVRFPFVKLFAFCPRENGPDSFFVMAETDEEARTAVEQTIEESDNPSNAGHWLGEGGGYDMKIADRGEVITDENDYESQD